ncbi:MAG TPA: hypothetical protein VK547_09750 [Candidatus Udaeobacter sp.]|nr:hypothetical protein [Candidatus Udaeobacter sp.]
MEQPHGGVGYEELVDRRYLRHTAHLGADKTLCGRPMGEFVTTIDPPSFDACPKCAAAEVQEAGGPPSPYAPA